MNAETTIAVFLVKLIVGFVFGFLFFGGLRKRE